MTIENKSDRRWAKYDVRKAKASPRPLSGTVIPTGVEADQCHPGRRMTEAEFVAFAGEKTRAEWVNGEVILMSPVSVEHDDLHGWFNAILRLFVEANDLGRIAGSELFVRLPKPQSRRLPDLFFVAQQRVAAFGKNAFEGAPDVVFEIVSPDSTARDYRDKLKHYESSGVKEYWIVDPLALRMEANELVKGKFRTIAEKDMAIRSKVLKGFLIKPEWCWRKPLPKVAAVLKELAL